MNISKMFSAIDTHVLGETFRIVTHSPIILSSNDVIDNNEQLQKNFTNVKNLLINEPRGHRGINGCLVLPSKVADYQLLFFTHHDVAEFKYEGILASLTALLETGNIEQTVNNVYLVETIKGIYRVSVNMEQDDIHDLQLIISESEIINKDDSSTSVCIENDRHYVVSELPSYIPTIDLTYLDLINKWGVNERERLDKLKVDYQGIILVEKMEASRDEFKSVTFEKDNYILRSPGIDSIIAIYESYANDPALLDEITVNTIFNSQLSVRRDETLPKQYSLTMRPYVTGSLEFIFDVEDPLKDGFLLK